MRKFARVGRPCNRSANSERTSGASSDVVSARPPADSLLDHVVEQPLQLGALPGVARAGQRQHVGGLADRRRPARHRLRPAQRIEHEAEPVDELGEAAGEIDRAALDVVDRQHALEQPVAVLGHRDAEQQPVDARPPRARRERLELVRRAVRGIQAPAHAAVGDPLLDAREVVVVEVEAPPDRVAVGEVEHLRRGQPRAREVEQLRDDAEHRVGLAQRAVGEPHAQVGQPGVDGRVLGVLVVAARADAERRVDERRERLDVGAHDDDVARLEGRVVLQQVQDRVARDLDLARAAVAGVDLHAAVVGPQQRASVGGAGQRLARRRAVGAHVGLDLREQRGAAVLDRVVMIDLLVVGPDDELQLARVLPPRGEQAVGRQRRGHVAGAAHDRRQPRARGGDLLPQHRRRMQEEEVHVAPRRQRAQHREPPGGQAREAEQRQPRRQRHQVRLRAQARARGLQPLGRTVDPDPRTQPPPQLGLPQRLVGQRPARAVEILAPRPRAHHLRPVQRVAIEQLGDVAHRAQPPRAPRLVALLVAGAEVRGQARQPRLAEAVLDDVEQRPHDVLDEPRVGVRLDARRRRHGIRDEPARRREVDVRADPVQPARADAEPRGQALRQPALHPPRRHGDDLGRERIGERLAQQIAERLDQAVRALSAVNVQHLRRSSVMRQAAALRPPRARAPTAPQQPDPAES